MKTRIRTIALVGCALAILFLAAISVFAQTGYNVDCLMQQGGDKWVGTSGCEWELQSGSTFDVQANTTVTWAADLPITGGQTNSNWLKIAGPTAIATATPVVVIDSLGLSVLLDVRDAATPVFSINNGGSWSSTGAGTHSSGQTINDWTLIAAPTDIATATPAAVIDNDGVSELLAVRDSGVDTFNIYNDGGVKVAGPTAIATAQPAAVVDSLGVSVLLEVRDAATPVAQFRNGGGLDLIANPIEQDLGTENIGVLKSVVSTAITYTVAAGGTGVITTITDGEIWIVHDVYVNVTTNFDATGDDATLDIGDGNDADGWCVLVDAELQAADTEGTGWQAGWQCQVAATIGVYGDEANGFIYAPSGADETIDYLIDEASGETLSAGEATVYVVYTRIQ